jgi:hypothetical protein
MKKKELSILKEVIQKLTEEQTSAIYGKQAQPLNPQQILRVTTKTTTKLK